MEIPNPSQFNGGNNNFRSINKYYPEFANFIMCNYPDDIKWLEKLYWYYHGIKDYPKCPVCGKRLRFYNFTIGYQKYCSAKCSNSAPEKIKKTKDICQEKYGGMGASSPEIRRRMAKTSQERYGVDNPILAEESRRKSKAAILEKYGGFGNASEKMRKTYKATMIERYGVENIMQNKEHLEKMQQNNLRKYGVKSTWQLPHAIQSHVEYHHQMTYKNHPDIIGHDENGNWICKCPHPDTCNKCQEKQFAIDKLLYRGRKKDGTEICPVLLPKGEANIKNTTIELFVQKILEDCNIEFETSNRKVIVPKELDIYIPSKNIAIEVNGLYWHNIDHKAKEDHLTKYQMCKTKNVRLISIWEDWQKLCPVLVEDIIKKSLGIYNSPNEDNLSTRIILPGTARKFMEANSLNHIRVDPTYKCIGLYDGPDLISVLVSSGSDIITWCDKIGIGGINTFKYLFDFLRNNKGSDPNEYTYMTSNDIFIYDMFLKECGFIQCEDNILEPIIVNFEDFSRETLSEIPDYNMTIFDSGKTKWIYNK